MGYTVEIKDDNGNVVTTSPINPRDGHMHCVIFETNLNKRADFHIDNLTQIQDFENFLRGARDLAKYRGLLGGRKRFTDIDAVAETGGYLINLEFKNGLEDINKAFAQIVKAIREAEYNKTFTLFVISKPDEADIEYIIPITPLNLDKIRNLKSEELPKHLIQRGNFERLKFYIRQIEEWVNRDENKRVDDAKDLADKVRDIVSRFNTKLK
jgi:hypothetical protein